LDQEAVAMASKLKKGLPKAVLAEESMLMTF
jgi:hypothetical protein